MAFSFKFYSDAGLTTELTAPYSRQLYDGSTPADENDTILYFGSIQASTKVRVNANPGVDPITLTPEYAVDAWSAAAAVSADDIVMPSTNNGYKYQAQGAGTTGGSEPTWPTTIGNTVVDNGITWECIDELHQPEEFKLALSAAGLDTAVAGAALGLGVEVLSGVSNAVPIHVRVDQDAHPLGTYTDIRLAMPELGEEAA